MKTRVMAPMMVPAFCLVAFAATDVACTKQQQQLAVHGGELACTMIAAYEGTPDEEALCADAGDLAELAMLVRADRADAGVDTARKAGKCVLVADVCATDGELSRAIHARKRSRSAIFKLGDGAAR